MAVLLARECGSYSDDMVAFAGEPDLRELDLRGLKCPLPVLRTRRALRGLAAGDTLVVQCTDPLASIDIPHLVRSEGHQLEASTQVDGVSTFRIIRGEDVTSA